MIDDGESGSDDGDTTTDTSSVEVASLAPVTAEASFYDPSLAVDGGCDPSGCVSDNTRVGCHHRTTGAVQYMHTMLLH